MKNGKILAAAMGIGLAAGISMLSYGADGRFISADGGWKYERADKSMAKGTWEDIDGEWYYFGSDGLMMTGWNKIGNIRYYLEPDGKLARGWQCYDEDGSEKWYYFDANGNAVIRWFKDNGKWYWFNANGTMNTEETKTIDGKRYYFHEDGSMRANEYNGLKYIDASGQLNSRYDVRAENRKGGKLSVDADVKEEIEETINAFPSGWLKKFVDDDWKFIYGPEKEYYSSVRLDSGNERYYVRYKLKTSEKAIYFTDVEALKMGFGEYMYKAAGKLPKNIQFPDEVKVRFYEISKLTGLPDECYDDYQMVFGAVFAKYQEEDEREQMRDEMEEVCWHIEEIMNSRNEDGTLIERLLKK